MSHHHHHSESDEHHHHPHPEQTPRRLHHDWRFWVAVVLMLGALLVYALTY